MKRLLIQLFLMLTFTSSSFVYSQDYEPFLNTSKRWNMTRTLFNNQAYTYTARVKQVDTLINGNIYQQIVADTIHPLTLGQAEGFLGYIREDLSSKKVYYTILDTNILPFYFEENEERLLYDFSLEEGDTVAVMNTFNCLPNQGNLITLEVLEIDSITLLDNTERKRWLLRSVGSWDLVYWIEGIGSEFGLYMPGCRYTALHWYEYALLCYYEDNIHLYQHSSSDSCGIFWASNVEVYGEKEVDFKVYPNPASDKLTVELEKDITGEIRLTDVNGTEVLQQNISGHFLEIDIHLLAGGVYYVKMVNDKVNFKSKKIVKL